MRSFSSFCEALRLAHSSPGHYFDIDAKFDGERTGGSEKMISRITQSHGAEWHDGNNAWKVHPSKVDSIKKDLTHHGIKFKHFTD